MTDVRVVLVDDHNLVRSGLRALLGTIAGIRVTGEADGAEAALAIVRADPPDIVITDISMKNVDGIELTTRLLREFPALRVIVLSMYSEERYVRGALRAGAAAYLLKDAAEVEFELALRAVMRGESFLSSAFARQVMDGYVQSGPLPAQSLTPRQREILKLIAEGHSAKEIAFALEISGKTVEAHRAQIMERLQIHDIAGLVKYALAEGLIQL